jgi:hypothetical protein
MPRRDETRPAATGRGPNGFSFDDEYSKDSADADREQLHLDLDVHWHDGPLLRRERGPSIDRGASHAEQVRSPLAVSP